MPPPLWKTWYFSTMLLIFLNIFFLRHHLILQTSPPLYNTIQYNTIQYNTIQYKKSRPFFFIKKKQGIGAWKTTLIILFRSSTRYLSWHGSNLFVFWGPIHYNPSHGMPMKARDISASILRNTLTSQSPLSCDLPLWFIGLCM